MEPHGDHHLGDLESGRSKMGRRSVVGILVVVAFLFFVAFLRTGGCGAGGTATSVSKLYQSKGPFLARVKASGNRVHPGQVVRFTLELVDAKGRSQPIPLRWGTPKLIVSDSSGRVIGTYTFEFG